MRNEKKFGIYTIAGTVIMYLGYVLGSMLPKNFLEGLLWCFLMTGMLCKVFRVGE